MCWDSVCVCYTSINSVVRSSEIGLLMLSVNAFQKISKSHLFVQSQMFVYIFPILMIVRSTLTIMIVQLFDDNIS